MEHEDARPRFSLHATTRHGRSHRVELTLDGTDIHDQLAQQLPGGAAAGVVLTEDAPPEPAVPEPGPSGGRQALSPDAVAAPPDHPLTPKPVSADTVLPEWSESVLVSAAEVPLFVYMWGDKGEAHGSYVPVTYRGRPATSPPFPEGARLAYRRSWHRALSRLIRGPEEFRREVTTTEGMSETNATTLSAELGVSVEGLAAKLSTTTTHSITIARESMCTETYELTVPQGQRAVFTVWQLVDVFVLLDRDGSPVEWRGRWSPYPELGFRFPARFPQNTFARPMDVYSIEPIFFPA